MSFFNRYFFYCAVTLVFASGSNAIAGEVLSMQQAEELALQQDFGSKRFQSIARALKEKSVSVGQLPDPKIKLGLMNFPVDTFKRDQEPMTQIQLGMQQMFPRGDSLAIKSKRSVTMAQSNEYRALDRQSQLRKQVRLKWLELYYWVRAKHVVTKNRKLFKQLVDVTQYHYSSGRRNQQDIVRAQLELSRLDDRILDIETRFEKVEADLAVLTGFNSDFITIDENLPSLELDFSKEELEGRLSSHPKILVASSLVQEKKHGVALAREAYKPGWMLGVNYGIRDGQNLNGSDRADFLSIGVTVDIPLFKEKRQDRNLKASQYQLGAMQQMSDQQMLELKRMLRKSFANWKRLEERDRFYRDSVLPKAKQNTQSSLFAYQNDRADFTTLMRARISELDTQLKSIRINVDRVQAQARLRYLAGEE